MLETIRSIICDYVDVEPKAVTPEASLRSDLGASSFDLMNVAVAIEEEFGLSIPNSKLTVVKTVGDIITLIN